MKAVASFSGGAGSWAAAKRAGKKFGIGNLELVFADTIIEDQDCYRLVLQGAANIYGIRCPPLLIDMVMGLPEISIDDPYCYARKQKLSKVRRLAANAIPRLHWILEGSHPWEIFEHKRIIGRSGIDPCSELLKRNLLDAWRAKHQVPSETIVIVGIDWSEKHRLVRIQKANPKWTWDAPCCWRPTLSKEGMLVWLKSEGIQPPRAYRLGAPHNNCGGFCIKAGVAHFAWLWRTWPNRYLFHEWWEQRLRKQVGDHSILKEQINGVVMNLTLEALRTRLECKMRGSFNLQEATDSAEWGGCGCAL